MSDNCEEIRELIAAYSIGATDAEETQRVRAALDDCPEAARELEEYAALATALHDAVPLRHEAPPAARILSRIEFGDEGETTPTENITPLTQPAPRRGFWWLSIAALFVIALLAIGSNLFWLDRVSELEANQAELVEQINTRPTPTTPFSVVLNPRNTHHRELSATTAGQPNAAARVIWNSEIEVGSLFVTGLEQLPADMAYQLWVVRDDETLSLGQFNVDDTGTGFMIFQSPEPIASFDAIGISPEPAEGSAQPTHDHVVVGRI